MISYLVEFFDSLNMRAYYRLLILEHSYVSIYFDVCKLFIVKVPQGSRYLIFSLVIEKDIVCMSVIIDLELSAHRFFKPSKQSANYDHVI